MDEKSRGAGGWGHRLADALERFMDNKDLMLKFVHRFPEDKNFPQLR